MPTKPILKSIPDIFNYKPQAKWKAYKHLKRFETRNQSIEYRKSKVKFLDKYRRGEAELINRLTKCKKGRRCKLLACPECMRKARIWYCDQVIDQVAKSPSAWTRISLIPDQFLFPEGDLQKFNPQYLIDCLRKGLKAAGLLSKIIMFGGIDYCVDVTYINRIDGHIFIRKWRPHLYLLTLCNDETRAALKKVFKRIFPKTAGVKRPVQFKRFYSDGSELLKPISYSFKSRYDSRFVSDTLPDFMQKEASKGNKPIKQRLHGRLQAELAAFMARQPLKSALIFIGMKRVQKSIVLTRALAL